MQHTAHHAIEVRLTLWKTFFETGHDATPDGATDDEYGMDDLIEMARNTYEPGLNDLADVVELMGVNYIQRLNNEHAAVLMLDAAPSRPRAPTERWLDEVAAAIVLD